MGVSNSQSAGKIHRQSQHALVALAQLVDQHGRTIAVALQHELVLVVEMGVAEITQQPHHGSTHSLQCLKRCEIIINHTFVFAQFGCFLQIKPLQHFPEVAAGIEAIHQRRSGMVVIVFGSAQALWHLNVPTAGTVVSKRRGERRGLCFV